MASLLGSLFTRSARSVVKRVRAAEARLGALDDAALRGVADALRERAGSGEPAERLMEEAFAAAAVAATRALGMRPFDVQVQGAVELARGKVVEMRTGEGKTLVATMPVVLHALGGLGCHVVTVNDYLARRDAEWMGPVYELLGLSVGYVQERMGASRPEEIALRRAAYGCDVTYVTNSECVFDHLRDNLARDLGEAVHRGFHFAVVDEADLLLVDEAQTPLIIAGPEPHDPAVVRRAATVVGGLRAGSHFRVDGRSRTASLTNSGLSRVEAEPGVGSLTSADNVVWAHAIYQALQARAVQRRDVDYVVHDDRVLLVDPHTGRVSQDKRLSNGLHQAIEAKEGVTVRSDNLTLARTSYQHFFRGYELLSGMTGTAWGAREELGATYGLEVARIPTHRAMIRVDHTPLTFRSTAAKRDAAVEEVLAAHRRGRPVLVGTLSVEESEAISEALHRAGVRHEVLNAKHHEREARVVAQAGRPGAVTISTNMAGRGTDIMLGGNPRYLATEEADPGTAEHAEALRRHEAAAEGDRARVVEAGGLLVVGTGEHEASRIDEQLRGRSGRQGDPGESRYFVSIDDPVYRRAARKEVLGELRAATRGLAEDEPIEDPAVLSTLGRLRRDLEVRNEAARRDLFKIDTVVHERRETVWAWRRALLEAEAESDWRDEARDLLRDLADRLAELAAGLHAEDGRLSSAEAWAGLLGQVLPWGPSAEEETRRVADGEAATRLLLARYDGRLGTSVDGAVARWERSILLEAIDVLWPEYLKELEAIEDEAWMRTYAQVDPFVEFRKEAARAFGRLMLEVEATAARAWLRVVVVEP